MPEDRSLPSLLVELGDWADIATERVETGRLPLALEALQSVSTLAGRALALVEPPPVPVPVPVPVPPTPKPPTTDSFGGSYGYGHDPAFDLYPNGEDGPHFGTPLYWPAYRARRRTSTVQPAAPEPLVQTGICQGSSWRSGLVLTHGSPVSLVHPTTLLENSSEGSCEGLESCWS
jgi:hypothetical protein